MDLLAVWLGKITPAGLRLLGRRGDALPGPGVEKLFPGVLARPVALLGKVAAATTGHVVLNRDDARIAALGAETRAAVTYFGVSAELRPAFPTDEELYGGPIAASDLPAAAELLRLPSRDESKLLIRI